MGNIENDGLDACYPDELFDDEDIYLEQLNERRAQLKRKMKMKNEHRPQWKPEVGDWAWVNFDEEFGRGCYNSPCEILAVQDDMIMIEFRMLNGHKDTLSWGYFRPLKSEDWIGEIHGMRVTATETENDYIHLDYIDKGGWNQFCNPEGKKIIRGLCADKHVFIKPWKLVQKEQTHTELVPVIEAGK